MVKNKTIASQVPERQYLAMLKTLFYFEQNSTTALTPAGRVFLQPFEVPFKCTVNKICFLVGVSIGNLRVAIYRSVGYTPAGGVLVVESDSVACGGAGAVQEISITATQLSPGLYWVAIRSDSTTMTISRITASSSNGPTFFHKYYVGVYGAFTDPCPAVTNTGAFHFNMYVLISSIP